MSFDRLLVLIILIQASFTDIRSRAIYPAVPFAAASVSVCLRILNGSLEPVSLIMAGFIFAVFYAVSVLTGGAIGEGDAWVFMALTAIAGIGEFLPVLFTGAALSALTGLFLLVMKRGEMRSELPFIPFLLAGFLLHYGFGKG